MQEYWKDVYSYEGIYQISSLGKVKSLERVRRGKGLSVCRVKERILKNYVNSRGYVFTRIQSNGVVINVSIHRLVAQAFIPNPESKPQVNHINGLKTDNKVMNLEWCTRKENMAHASRIGLFKGLNLGEKHGKSILNRKSVLKIREERNSGKKYREISEMLGFSTSLCISAVKNWKHI